MAQVRTRIAPAPTGYLHIGTARTALFNYLFAKKNGGTFVVRIEDTDVERSDPKYETEILGSLEWLGIHADESPVNGGPYGPYRQSERTASYTKYLQKLLAQGNAFYCFHSESELGSEREELAEARRAPLHQCVHRGLSLREAEEKLKAGERAIIRFKTPAARTLTFTDLIRGEIQFESNLLGDFSLAKDLTTPLYNFAVVIDDFEMQISHVIRGEDHIPNTPKQILIQEALGLLRSQHAHLPLILGSDRAKLSKRHGATAIREFREAGYLPEALVNFMALLGWNPGGEQEIFSMADFIAAFDLANIQKGGAIFNIEKLDWLNGGYIRRISPAALGRALVPYLRGQKFIGETYDAALVTKMAELEQPRLKKLSEIGERADYFFRDPEYDRELIRWKEMTDAEIAASLERSRKIVTDIPESDFSVEKLQELFLKEIGKGDKGILLWPLRVVLTGKKASPGPFEIMAILGKEKVLKRIEAAKIRF